MAAVCFEGLGRKFLPFIPATLFYFFKDVILVAILMMFGMDPHHKKFIRRVMGRPFLVAGGIAFLLTAIQCLNPNQSVWFLPLLGLKAYWLWWLAPLAVSALLSHPKDEYRGIRALALFSLVISGLAIIQFAAPSSASINTYALYEEREMNSVDIVLSTGRARVASTFSYFTGFSNYVLLVPPLILAFALEAGRGRQRPLAYLVLAASLATVPMTGSRGAVALAAFNVFLVAWGAGFLRTAVGRRLIVGIVVGGIAGLVLFPEAIGGVMDRFAYKDTNARMKEFLQLLPPVAIETLPHPFLGIGTGMTQNVAIALKLYTGPYFFEGEPSRLLIELGPIGYLAVWTARLGLTVALVRAAQLLRKGGRGGLAGVALMLAMQAQLARFVSDHVYQSLYFLVAGFVLHAVVNLPQVRASLAPTARVRTQKGQPVRVPIRSPAMPTGRQS